MFNMYQYISGNRMDQKVEPNDFIAVPKDGGYIYLGKKRIQPGLDWETQIRELADRNAKMPTIRDLIDLLMLLESDEPIFDGAGNKISGIERRLILTEQFYTNGSEINSEYLNNLFNCVDEGEHRVLIMSSEYQISDCDLVPFNTYGPYEPIFGRVLFDDINGNGLPTKMVEKKQRQGYKKGEESTLFKGNMFFDGLHLLGAAIFTTKRAYVFGQYLGERYIGIFGQCSKEDCLGIREMRHDFS